MAERSTAQSADGAVPSPDDSTSGLDSWIARRSRLAGDDSDTSYRLEAGAPQWREDVPDPYEEWPQPEDTYPGRDRAYGEADTVVYPEPAYYEQPDQTYRYDGHGPAGPEEPPAEEPYAPSEAGSVHDPSAAEGAPRRTRSRQLAAPPRPANRRRRWLIPVAGLAVAALLGALAVSWASGRPPEGGLPAPAGTSPAGPAEEPAALPEVPLTPSGSGMLGAAATPSATASVTPSATPSATPSVTPPATPAPRPTGATPAQTRSPGPALLGPSGSRGVTNLVQRYCDRYAGGSADARNDGRWQCTRLLSASIVDMDVACRETYGSGAYARTSDADDPYAWRCYR